MNTERTATLLVMEPPLLPTGKRLVPKNSKKISKGEQVQDCENKAVNAFKNRLEEEFITAIKNSPSKSTIDFGITVAVEAGWHKALEELLPIDLSTYKPLKYDSYGEHPLQDQVLSMLRLPPASGSKGRGGYANVALLYAIVSGKVDAVRILVKYMDVNIDDASGRPLLDYVYLLNQQDVKKKILDIVVPKLEPSIINLLTVSKNGDLESAKHLVERLQPKDRHRIVLVGTEAILNDHDDIAKWIVETPGLMNWENDAGCLVAMAVRRENVGMIEFLSMHSPGLLLHQFDDSVASDLWAYLQRVNRTELFSKFIPSHPEGYSLSS